MPPPQSYILEGQIRTNSLVKGSAEIEHTVNTDNNGQTGLDLYIGGGTTTAETTVYIKNVTQNETKTVTSNPSGIWNFDCSNFSAYENEDSILIYASTYTTRDTEETGEKFVRENQEWHEEAQARKIILVNQRGNDYNIENPMPVTPIDENLDSVNGARSWSITNADGQPDYEEVTYKGVTYRRTFTYTLLSGMRNLTLRSAWLEQ